MPPRESTIVTWFNFAQRFPGITYDRLLEELLEQFDEEPAEEIARLVMARQSDHRPPPPRPAPPQPGAPRGGQGQRRPAAPTDLPEPTSPYRFVELNTQVIPAPEAVQLAEKVEGGTGLDLPLAGGVSGRITVDWVAETPLLIGTEGGTAEDPEIVPLRLGPEGDYPIPGATLKGMLRVGLEIITLGRLSQLNRQHRFGLRDFADPRYRDGERGRSRLAWEAIGSGWLEKYEAGPDDRARGFSDYQITPCDKRTIRIRDLPWVAERGANGYEHLKWLQSDLEKKYQRAGMHGQYYDFSQTDHFAVAPNGTVRPAAAGAGEEGVYVFSGPLPLPRTDHTKLAAKLDEEDRQTGPGFKKKREYVFFDRAGAEPVRLSQAVFDAFELINSTPSGRGLEPSGSWKELRPTLDAGKRIPVFILGDLEAPRFDFGLTRSFKVAHDQSVGEVLDRQTGQQHRLRGDQPLDWAEAMFGRVIEPEDLAAPDDPAARRQPREAVAPKALARRGRIAVGFARTPATSAALFPPGGPLETTMMGPRASFAPHYLVGARKHWSDRAAGLAGRKRYFPRFPGGTAQASDLLTQDHTLPPEKGGEATVSRLRFLVPGAGAGPLRFVGTIQVHNLLPEELGALLWVVTHGGALPGPYRHMIGRAKAFGAGQIRVDKLMLALQGHDAEADSLIADPAPLSRFIACFEAAMEAGAKAAGLRGGWRAQPQIAEFLGLSDPAWGAAERSLKHAHYPGAMAAVREGLRGMDMANGPRAHTDLRRALRRDLGQPDAADHGPPRWLPLPKAPVLRGRE